MNKGGHLTRNERQLTIGQWCISAFGEKQATSLPQRGLRLLEEALETAQAAGVTEEQAYRVVSYVFFREVGELSQELGGLGVTALALGQAAGIDVDLAEQTEVGRILSKPVEHWAARNQKKNDVGLVAV